MSNNDPAELALATFLASIGFVGADAFDRFLASYDPSSSTKPLDKFTSDGAGNLANSLNVASPPGVARVAAGVAATALPAVGAMIVDDPLAKAGLEGLAVGAGVSLMKTLWNTVVMPMLAPSDTSTPSLQKSLVSRLYPAETAAAANLKEHKEGPHAATGVLSGPQWPALGTGDPGPFALSDSSPYDDASQAIRRAAGVGGDSPYSSTHDALRHAAGVSGDSPYLDTNAALRHAASLGWVPAPGADTGPGPAGPQSDDCGCGVGDNTARFAAFLGDGPNEHSNGAKQGLLLGWTFDNR